MSQINQTLSLKEELYVRLSRCLPNGEFRRLLALTLALGNASGNEIEKETGLTREAVFYLIKRIEAHGIEGLVDRRKGRKKKFVDDLQSRIIELLVTLERPSARAISEALYEQDETAVSPSQVRRLLKRWEIGYRRTRFCPIPTPKRFHAQARALSEDLERILALD